MCTHRHAHMHTHSAGRGGTWRCGSGKGGWGAVYLPGVGACGMGMGVSTGEGVWGGWGCVSGGGWAGGLHTSWVKVQVGVGVGVSMGMNFVEHLQPMHVVSQGKTLGRGHSQGVLRGGSGHGQAQGGGWQPCTQHIMGQQRLCLAVCAGDSGTGGREGDSCYTGHMDTTTTRGRSCRTSEVVVVVTLQRYMGGRTQATQVVVQEGRQILQR